jgi:hypothetical protein
LVWHISEIWILDRGKPLQRRKKGFLGEPRMARPLSFVVREEDIERIGKLLMTHKFQTFENVSLLAG